MWACVCVQYLITFRRACSLTQTRVLHNVFPPHIAEMLKRGEKVKPERRDDVTIFFSDIVGFTDISATIKPEKISDMLDRLYTKFDALIDKHDIYKVDTIGGWVERGQRIKQLEPSKSSFFFCTNR